MALQYDAVTNGPLDKCVAVTSNGDKHVVVQRAFAPGEATEFATACSIRNGATVEKGTPDCAACAKALAG